MSINIESFSDPTSERNAELISGIGGISLKELYQELERKDLVIKNLQSQLNSTRSNTNSIINSKISNFNKEETTLKKQILEKDKLLLEKDNEILELKNELKNNKKNFVETKENSSDLQNEISELKTQIKNYDLRLSAKENENKKKYLNYENKIKLLEKEKKSIEAKTTQLVEIVKQYSKELSDVSIKFQSLDAEKLTLSNLNNKLNQKNEKNEKIIKELNEKINSMNSVFNQNENLTITLNKIQKELNKEIEEKKNLQKDIIYREEIIKNLTNQLTEFTSYKTSYEASEKELIKLKAELNDINAKNNINTQRANESENELNNLAIILNRKINQIVEWIETYFGVYYNYEITDIPKCNDINSTIRFDLIIDELCKKRKQIQDNLSNLENKNKDNERKLNEFFSKMDLLQQDNIELTKNFNNEKDDNLRNKKELEDNKLEIQKLKKNIFEFKNENESMKKINDNTIDYYNKKLQNIINSIINDSNLTNFVKNCKNIFDSEQSFENLLNKVNEIIQLFKNEYLKLINTQKQNHELCDIIERINKEKTELLNNLNDMNNENEIIKNEIDFSNKDRDSINKTNQSLLNEKNSLVNLVNSLNKKNDLLTKENKELCENLLSLQKKNEELQNTISKIQQSFEKNANDKINSIINEFSNKSIDTEENLKFANKLLEKRLMNLQTQMDLKDIQIKSQEEIINRRNKMLNDSLSLNQNSNSKNDDSLIRELEIDKEKLISDNVVLINDNKMLRQQIESLNIECHQKDMIIQNLSNK